MLFAGEESTTVTAGLEGPDARRRANSSSAFVTSYAGQADAGPMSAPDLQQFACSMNQRLPET